MEWDAILKARRDFVELIKRCGCSRAALHVTEEESKKAKNEGIVLEPVIPSCTPKKCYPALHGLLYPHGGFHTVSDLVQRYRVREKAKK